MPLRDVPENPTGDSPGRRTGSIAMAINRRSFVVRGTIATAGLVIGVTLAPVKAFAQENEKAPKKPPVNPFDAYIHVKPDGNISLIVAKSEMGQGIKTGLAMISPERDKTNLFSVAGG